MLDYQLFLGLSLPAPYQQELNQQSSAWRHLLIQSRPSLYLQQVEYEGTTYLGKYVGSVVELTALDSLQAHIHSLLKRLIPLYSYEKYPLLLFALPSP